MQHILKGLRHLYDLVESQVRCLKTLGSRVASHFEPGNHWNLDSLLEQLEEEFKAHERAMPSSIHPPTVKKSGTRNNFIGTAATLIASTNPPSCCFHQQFHPSSECKAVLDIGERRQILMRSGRCFICLKKYHISKNCRSATRCRNCGGRHHAIHNKTKLANPTKPLNPQANTHNNYAGTSSGVFLQTARTKIYNPDGLTHP